MYLAARQTCMTGLEHFTTQPDDVMELRALDNMKRIKAELTASASSASTGDIAATQQHVLDREREHWV